MAKLTAPVLSFDARGTIAKTLTFAAWRGVNYARQRVVPANPNTSGQQTTRTVFATLREMWKRMDADQRAPWDAYAEGRPFLGLNSFIGENMLVVRGDSLFTDFVGSPGAKGGLGLTSVAAVAGGSSGEIDVTITPPTLPTDWTWVEGVAMAFPDQDPETNFGGLFVVGTDATNPAAITLAGLGSAVSCIVAGWGVYTKPNGETAYSPSITDTVSAAA